MKQFAFILILAGLIGNAIPVQANMMYSFQTIIYPGDTFTQTLGINNASVIAGYHGSAPNQGFVLTLPNSFIPENFPGSAQTQVIGINSVGKTAGFYIDAGGITHGFLDTAGTFSSIDAPGTAFNQFLGLNDIGQAAGYSSTDSTGATLQQAYVYSESGSTFTYLTPTLPLGAENNQATDINNGGMISGFYLTSSTASHGFLLSGGTLTTLDFPGSIFTQALGLNNPGQVVGSYTDPSGATHGFVYLNSQYQSIDDSLGGRYDHDQWDQRPRAVGWVLCGRKWKHRWICCHSQRRSRTCHHAPCWVGSCWSLGSEKEV